MLKLSRHQDSVLLPVKVHPGARRAQIAGVIGDRLKVAVTAPPVDGKANQAVTDFLAQQLGLPRSAVSIHSGAGSREKVVRIAGMSTASVGEALGALGIESTDQSNSSE